MEHKKDIPTFVPRSFNRGFAWFNLAMILGIAAGAFTVSFAQQRKLAIASGISSGLAWLIPVVVDLTLLALTSTAAQKRLEGKSIVWPVSLVAIASAATLFFNIYLAPTEFITDDLALNAYFPTIIPIIVVTVLVHSVPPVFLFFMIETTALSLRSLLPEYSGPPTNEKSGHSDDSSGNGKPNGTIHRDTGPATEAKRKKSAKRKQTAKELADEGLPKREIRDQLGLKSIRQINRYLTDAETS